MTPDPALLEAIRKVRDRDFAHLTAFALTLAAETSPDIIRKALATVFDMRDWAAKEQAIEVKLKGLELLIDNAKEEIRSFVTERNTLRKQVVWQQNQIDDLKETIEKIRAWAGTIKPAPSVQNGLPQTPVRRPAIETQAAEPAATKKN